MADDTKIVFWGYLTLDYKAVQRYLENMALQGYELISIYTKVPFAKFRKIIPRRITYYVDIFGEKESESYIDLCEDSGWQFVGSKELMHIFKAKNNCKPIPIQTDIEIENNIIKKSFIKKEVMSLLISFLILLLLFYYNIIKFDYNILLSYSSCLNLFLIPVSILYSIIHILYLFIFIIKSKRTIKKGEKLKVPTVKSSKIRSYSYFLFKVIINVILILSFFGEFCNISQIILIALVLITIGIFTAILIKKFLRYTDQMEKIRNIVLVVIISIAAFVALTQFNLEEVSYLSFSDWGSDENREKAVEYPVLMFDDFFKDKELSFTFTSFRETKSIFIKEYYSYKEGAYGKGIISTDYYEAKNIYFAKIIFDGIVKERDDTEARYINSQLFNADKIVYFKNSDINTVLILKENKVIFISSEIDFLTEQNRKKVIEVLGL